MLGEKLFAPGCHRAEKSDVVFSLGVRRLARARQHSVVAEMEMVTAQAAPAIGQDAQRIDVGHRTRGGRPVEIAVEPDGLGLFGAKEHDVAGQLTRSCPRDLLGQKQVIKLMRGDHDLKSIGRGIFGRHFIEPRKVMSYSRSGCDGWRGFASIPW